MVTNTYNLSDYWNVIIWIRAYWLWLSHCMKEEAMPNAQGVWESLSVCLSHTHAEQSGGWLVLGPHSSPWLMGNSSKQACLMATSLRHSCLAPHHTLGFEAELLATIFIVVVGVIIVIICVVLWCHEKQGWRKPRVRLDSPGGHFWCMDFMIDSMILHLLDKWQAS